ncbi:MAG: hypothetical protein ACRDZ9_09100 [Acidimicrobiales bacterium]
MGSHRSSFAKLQRDRAKKAKAAAKREQRQERADPDAATPEDPGRRLDAPARRESHELTAAELLRRIEAVHQRFEAGTMSYEDFEAQKAELLARLPVD